MSSTPVSSIDLQGDNSIICETKRTNRKRHLKVPFKLSKNYKRRVKQVDKTLEQEKREKFISDCVPLSIGCLITGKQEYRQLEPTRIENLKARIKSDPQVEFSQVPAVYVNKDARKFVKKWNKARMKGETQEERAVSEREFLDKYSYIVLGGQHAIEAQKQLVEDNEQEPLDFDISCLQERMCCLYGKVSSELQQYISRKHQEVGEFVQKIELKDLVFSARDRRKKFYYTNKNGKTVLDKARWRDEVISGLGIDTAVAGVEKRHRERNALLFTLANLEPATFMFYEQWLGEYESGLEGKPKKFTPGCCKKWSKIPDEILQEEFQKLFHGGGNYTLNDSQETCQRYKNLKEVRSLILTVLNMKESDSIFSENSVYRNYFNDDILIAHGFDKLDFGKKESFATLQNFVGRIKQQISGEKPATDLPTFQSARKLTFCWYDVAKKPGDLMTITSRLKGFHGIDLAVFDLSQQGTLTEEFMSDLRLFVDVIHELNSMQKVTDFRFIFLCSPAAFNKLLSVVENPASVDYLSAYIRDFLFVDSCNEYVTPLGILVIRKGMAVLPGRKLQEPFFFDFADNMSFSLALVEFFSKQDDFILSCYCNGNILLSSLQKDRSTLSFLAQNTDVEQINDRLIPYKWTIVKENDGSVGGNRIQNWSTASVLGESSINGAQIN